MSFAQSTAKALGSTEYTKQDHDLINLRRQRLPKGGIGIDRLLSLCGITESKQVYPPTSQNSFVQLISDIEHGQSTDEAKSRAIFYLFLDFSKPSKIDFTNEQPSKTVAQYYASEIWMSQSEQSLVAALWFFDHGLPQKSLELLGQPFDLFLSRTLNDYIVVSLSEQKVGAVANYLPLVPPERYIDELAKSLLLKGKFSEVLNLSRQHNQPKYLVEMTKAAIETKENSLELVQQPFNHGEWRIISEELIRIIGCASPTLNETSNTAKLASDILLVRALHTGDTDILKELQQKTEDPTKLLVTQYLPYKSNTGSTKSKASLLMYD